MRQATELDDAQPAVAASELRSRLLERAVKVLAVAAEAGDRELAEACRGVLDGLGSRPDDPEPVDGAGPQTQRVRTQASAPPAPPEWAALSVPDDGGITHETASRWHPTIKVGGANGWDLMPTDIVLTVTDMLVDGRWIRTQPVVQVEGGSYSLKGIRDLHAALGMFMTMIDTKEFAAIA